MDCFPDNIVQPTAREVFRFGIVWEFLLNSYHTTTFPNFPTSQSISLQPSFHPDTHCFLTHWRQNKDMCKRNDFYMWWSCENSCTFRWHVYERDRQKYCRQCRKPILGKYIAKPLIPIILKSPKLLL